MPRMYEPLWEQLSTAGMVRIRCAPDAVSRIKKAVIKEKDMAADPKWRHRRLLISISKGTEPNTSDVEFRLVAKLSSIANI